MTTWREMRKKKVEQQYFQQDKNKVLETPPGGLFGMSVSRGAQAQGSCSGMRACGQSFCIPAAWEYKKFEKKINSKLGFEYPHHLWLSTLLKLHNKRAKVSFTSPHTSQEFGANSQKQQLRWL